jgi:hypothetical protein
LNTRVAKLARDVECTGILIGLDANKRDKAKITIARKPLQQFRHVDPRVEFVNCLDIDFNVGAKRGLRDTIQGNSVNACQRIRWNERAPPPYNVSVLAIMGRLDEKKLKSSRQGLSNLRHANKSKKST